MSMHHNCPRCRLQVAEERLKVAPFVCDHCGFTISKPNSVPEHLAEKSDSHLLMGISGGIVIVFLLLASSVELRWLQVRDFVGLSSYSSLERMVQVCTGLRNYSCVEYSLAKQAKWDPKRSVRLAEYLMSRNKFKEAVQGLKKYATKGKPDAKTLAMYGRALAEAGNIEEASKYFERAIAGSRPPLEHMQTYVKYLTRGKRFDQALSVILRARRVKANALAVEYRVISEMRSATSNRVVAGKR